MSALTITGLTIFIIVQFIGIFSIIFGLPGTLIILVDVIIYAILTGFKEISITIIIILIAMSAIAEILDFVTGTAGAKRFGSSRRGIWASIIGGIIGAIIMTPFLYGLGTVLGAFLGGFAGTFFVEYFEHKKLKTAFRAGYGAMIGKIIGVMLKGFIAITMTIISLTAIYS